jgi:hypothetical protein
MTKEYIKQRHMVGKKTQVIYLQRIQKIKLIAYEVGTYHVLQYQADVHIEHEVAL